jgi:serine/threonine-protein kinase
MPVQVCVRIALEIARGLHAAHELQAGGRPLGLVHRDLSPQNVLVGFDGSSRITDFGIAKALGSSTRTATGVIKGKMAYMAPEQLRFEEPDRRCDLFALGVVIFEMLSGEPMTTGTQAERARSNLEDPPPDIGEVRSDVPDDLVKLLFELLAKDRAERPADARTVVRRLEGVLSGLLAEEEPQDVVDYVDVVAGDVKREQERAIQAALAAMPARTAAAAAVKQTSADVTLVDPATRRQRWLVAAAAVAIAVGAAAVIAWPRHEAASETRGRDAADAADAVREAVAAPRSSSEVPAPSGASPAGADEAVPAAGDSGSARDATSSATAAEEIPPAAERRRTKARATKRGDKRLPDWVGFER